MIELSEPDWGVDPKGKSFGYDVKVFRDGCGDFPTETRVFISKSMIEDGFAPLWLVKRTEEKAKEDVNFEGKYPDEEF